jgi:hypothetical protein
MVGWMVVWMVVPKKKGGAVEMVGRVWMVVPKKKGGAVEMVGRVWMVVPKKKGGAVEMVGRDDVRLLCDLAAWTNVR